MIRGGATLEALVAVHIEAVALVTAMAIVAAAEAFHQGENIYITLRQYLYHLGLTQGQGQDLDLQYHLMLSAD